MQINVTTLNCFTQFKQLDVPLTLSVRLKLWWVCWIKFNKLYCINFKWVSNSPRPSEIKNYRCKWKDTYFTLATDYLNCAIRSTVSRCTDKMLANKNFRFFNFFKLWIIFISINFSCYTLKRKRSKHLVLQCIPHRVMSVSLLSIWNEYILLHLQPLRTKNSRYKLL